jgi:hypothetical protein
MLQNTSGLSDSKAVRTQQLIDLNAAFPNQLPQSQIIEMLGLAQGDKFYDIGSAAARAAEQENETIFDGQGQVEPMEYEDHLTHWRVHLQSIQSMGFKQKASPEIQNAIKLHIMAHEYLMIDLAVKSPPFAQMVGALPGFPLFANLPPVPEMPPMPPMGPEMGPGTAKPSGPMAEQGPPPAPEQQV